MDERLFRALVENSSDAIFLVDGEGRIAYASPSITRVLGFRAEEMVGTSGFDLVHPDERLALMPEPGALGDANA